MTTHPSGTPQFAQQPIVITTTNNPGQAQQYFPGHPQGNLAFPFFLTPPLTSMPSTPPTPDSPLFPYPTGTTNPITGGTTYSA